MSQYIRKVVSAVESTEPDQARAQLDQIARLQPQESMFHKGVDIAQAILKKLDNIDMSTHIVPPIFSVGGDDQGELLGFCDAIGVRDLSVIEESLYLQGKVKIDFDLITSVAELTERERTFMLGRLPAVRVVFNSLDS